MRPLSKQLYLPDCRHERPKSNIQKMSPLSLAKNQLGGLVRPPIRLWVRRARVKKCKKAHFRVGMGRDVSTNCSPVRKHIMSPYY